VAVKSKYLEDVETFRHLAQESFKRLIYNQENILKLLGYKFLSQSKMCGVNHKCYLFYEYYVYTLE